MRSSSKLPPPPPLAEAGLTAEEYRLHKYGELADSLLHSQVGALESRARSLKFAHSARAGLAIADEMRARSSSRNRSSSRGRQPSPFGQRGFSQDSHDDRLLRSTGSLSARSVNSGSVNSGIYHLQGLPASLQPRTTTPKRSMTPQRSMSAVPLMRRGPMVASYQLPHTPMTASSSNASIPLAVPSSPLHYEHTYAAFAKGHLPLPPSMIPPSDFQVPTTYGGRRLVPTTYGGQPHFLTVNRARAVEILGRSIHKAQVRSMRHALKTFWELRINSLVQSMLPMSKNTFKPSLPVEERNGARADYLLRILLGLRTLVCWVDDYNLSLLRVGLIQFFNYDREDVSTTDASSTCLNLDFSGTRMPAPPRNHDLSTSNAMVCFEDPRGPTGGAFAAMPALPKEELERLQYQASNVRTTEVRLPSWPATPDHSHRAHDSKRVEEYSFVTPGERLETNGYATSSRNPGVASDAVPTYHRIGARLPEAPQTSALRVEGIPLVGRNFHEEARSSNHSFSANPETRPRSFGPSDPYVSQAASSVSQPMPYEFSRSSKVSFARSAHFFSADSIDDNGGTSEWWSKPPEDCPESKESLHDKYTTEDVRKRATLAAEALGIAKDAPAKDITKAFFGRAKMHHPDKGGDKDDFYIVNEAYQRLKASTG